MLTQMHSEGRAHTFAITARADPRVEARVWKIAADSGRGGGGRVVCVMCT
jgi:hypothetical protein